MAEFTLPAPEPGSISPSLDLLTKDVIPNAREVYDAQNPMSQFKEVEPNLVDAGGAKLIDMNARARLGGFRSPMSHFKEVDSPTLPGFKEADDLDVKSVEELDKARDTFRPAEYFSSNPDLPNDPKKLAKLIEVYRRRDEEGLVAGRVISAATKGTPSLLADIGGGIKRFGERAVDALVQPTANVVLGTLTGDLFDDQKRAALFSETRKTIKKAVAEGSAGAESAGVSLADLSRQGTQKLDTPAVSREESKYLQQLATKAGRRDPNLPITESGGKTDQQLLAQLADDAAFQKNAADILTGRGEAAKNFGLDKETLAKQGIELDENAIRQLSLVDPITMVATGGAFKLVGLGGKLLGTARTLEGAQQLTDKLAKVASVSRTAKIAGGILETTGKVAAETRGFGGRSLTAAGIVAGGLDVGIATKAATKALDIFALPAIKRTGKKFEQAGRIVAGKPLLDVSRAAAESSAGAQRLASLVTEGIETLETAGTGAKVIGQGAFKGLVAGAPFAVVAQDDETAGSLLGVGAALGAGGAAGAGAFRVVKNSASRRFFGENRPVLEDLPSPDYGQDAGLDGVHRENIQKLSAQDASELNNFREALRQQGGEIYAVDRPTFRQKVAEEYFNRTGQSIDSTLLDTYENHSAFFDETRGDRKVVYLNSDTSGLHHDAGHIFDAILSEEKRAELRKAVEEAYTPEQRQAFRDTYERRVGSKISDRAAIDEFLAEQFSALFHNVPVTELNAPRSLLNKFIDVAAEGAEALGIDLTAGATTPSLGAPVSVGIRNLFRNAAGEVTRAKIEGVPADNIIKLPGDEPPPPDGGVPAPTPTPPPTGGSPATVIPLPRAPSRPIRPSGTDLPAPVTPEARAAAAARFAETGIENARLNAASDPVIARAVEDVSVHMEAGNPVLEVDHLGVVSEGTPDSPEGRTSRRVTQAAGYEALKGELSRAGAPADLVASHLKTFVPVRWTQQGGTPTLVAMSLDKALQNIKRVGSDPKAASLIPYPTENGKLTAQGWRDAVSDLVKYSENQANGRRGDGGRLTVPEAGELSIPAENPTYAPQPLSAEKADFQNLIMGLGTPETARRLPKGQTPGNVKGQILADANLRPTESPASIAPRRAGKQAFVDFPPRTVQEVNPLRNRLKEAGVDTKELIEVTERIRAIDIERVTPRPDISFKAPVTDIIRGGFLPATEFRQKNLQGKTVEEFAKTILDSSPEEWKAATDAFTGGLTGGAWSLGLGLKNAADVGVLKAFQEKLSDATKAAMKSGDFDGAYSLVSKGQFMREAYEAATGTGSAGAAFKRGTMGTEGVKVPFPAVEKTQATAAAAPDTTTITIGEGGAQFLPRTESGKTLEKQGYKIRPFGELGVRGVEIFDRDNNRAGEIISEAVTENEVGIQNVLVRPQFRGKGIGEALYRELGAQLKEDGVTRVIGDVVAPEPLALRQKVFGEFENIQVNGEPASLGDALTAANMTRKGVQLSHVEAANRITPESRFLPAEELVVGSTEAAPPELRVLPAAPGGRPPIEPPGLRPPPVAAGFQPAEELQQDETPGVRVLPAAPGGRPPTDRPAVRPPPVAAGVARDDEAAGFQPKSDEKIQGLAKSYAADAGIAYTPRGGYAEINPDLSKRLADFYEAAKSDPNDPAVKASYDALIRETEEQGKSILAAGYKIEPWTDAGEPYKNSAEAIADVRENKHLFFRRTSDSFGTGTEAAGNPMLAESRLVPGQSVNDVFRWVHDFFGHSKEGYQFGPRGEFNAWRAHSEMYSPDAQGALAAETLAQNSWVNFGPQAKDLPLAERPFAEQKNVVVPKQLIDEAAGFQPRTESGRKLEERGFEIVPSGEFGIRRVAVTKDGQEVAFIQSVQRSPKNAEISFVRKTDSAPKGVGEVLYREIGSKLRDDGVTSLEGQIISPEPLAIRRKVFGDFSSLRVNNEPASFDQAIATAERVRNQTDNEFAAIEPVNTISEATRFLPRVKRDAQGRPLKKNGDIDYPKWQAEGLAARKKQRAESDRAEPLKEVGPLVDEVEQTKLTGWILPDKTFVPLDTNFHEQYLAQNAADLNKKFGTEFTPDESSVDERLAALNAGFVRLRNQNGQLRVEVNAGKFRSVKSKLMNVLQDREGQIDGLTVSLLNDQGVEVDSTSAARLHELSGPEKFDKISEAIDSLRGAGFQPAGEGLPGIGVPSVEEAGRARAARRISSVKKNNPEAVVPQYARDEDGQVIVKPDGDPKTVTLDYNFIETPLAREAAKGLKGAAREEAATAAVGEKLVDLFKYVEKNPDITAGAKWYSTARTRLKKVFGDDSKFFAELLGATSARTPVDINYRFALDAYNQFKAGAYDKVLAKYREGKTKWDVQELGDFKGETRGQFMDYWVRKHDLGVTQSSGAKFGMNSRAVLRVLDGSWASEVKGPKTPNFAGNLTGETFEATIDVWAARTLARLSNEDGKTRWRILSENETGVTDADFYFGQSAYRAAAKKLGIKPDALQAVLWFAEKDYWEKKGWTRGAGAEKSDFNVLLNETERTPEGTLRMRTPQIGLDFGADLGNISKKKK